MSLRTLKLKVELAMKPVELSFYIRKMPVPSQISDSCFSLVPLITIVCIVIAVSLKGMISESTTMHNQISIKIIRRIESHPMISDKLRGNTSQ